MRYTFSMNTNTMSLVLYALALLCAFWAVAGLVNPQTLCFALPENRTRKNAFLFPLLRLAVPFAIVARITDGLTGVTAWTSAVALCAAFLWYTAKRAAALRGEYVDLYSLHDLR